MDEAIDFVDLRAVGLHRGIVRSADGWRVPHSSHHVPGEFPFFLRAGVLREDGLTLRRVMLHNAKLRRRKDGLDLFG